MVQIVTCLLLIALVGLSRGTNTLRSQQVHNIKSNDTDREPTYLIDLNKPPPSDHEESFRNIEANQNSPKDKSNEQIKTYMTRKEVNATFATCSHRHQCPHWDFMTNIEKQWSRTRRNRYADSDDVRRAKSQRCNRMYRLKLNTDPKRKKALYDRINARRQAKLSKMTKNEKYEYYEKRRAVSQKSKAKMRELKEASQSLTVEGDEKEIQ